MSNREQRPVVQRQMVFAEDGEIEPEDGPIGTSLEDFGAEVDHREQESQVERARASEFGIDDRPKVKRAESGEGEQAGLFTSAAEDQRTLAGEKATGQSLF
jgi:hypothetical protein